MKDREPRVDPSKIHEFFTNNPNVRPEDYINIETMDEKQAWDLSILLKAGTKLFQWKNKDVNAPEYLD